jgi:predicted enzyme related to lactoylglutathione lyase
VTINRSKTRQAPASLGWITIDCHDAAVQAEFYRDALGWEITFSEGPYSGISDGTFTIEFNAVEGYRPPRWPDVGGAKQFHLELLVDDLEQAGAVLVAAGAAQPEFQPGGDRFRVLIDPAGHPFCIIARPDAPAG